MILQALNAYYQQMAGDGDVNVPEYGFGRQGVQFCLTLDRQGNLVGDPMDLRDEKGKARRIEVPGPVTRSVGIASNFAWDNTGYVLGVDDKGKPERTAQTHAAFKELCAEVLREADDTGASALLRFLQTWNPSEADSLASWEEIVGWNVVFRLDGENRFLHDRPAFREAWVRHLESDDSKARSMCLVTGEDGAAIPKTHPKVKGVPGAQTAGASLVSFNIDAAASFNKDQNLNAPVSDKAAFAYTTALNYLLDPTNERKVQVGDTTVVFWTDALKSDAEALFSFAMGGKKAEDENVVLRLEQHLSSIARGALPDELGDPDTRFYVLGLSPNAARLSVRFWHVGTVGDMANNLAEHFRALAIKRTYDNEPEHPGPWWFLKELAPHQDSKNMSPLLSGQLIKAIVDKKPYPRTLLSAALGRIRADRQINYLRAAIIKAYLVRNEKQEIHMTLDSENTNIGYRLGRLFAIIEQTQRAAMGKINATVTDKYFASAAATPELVYPILIKSTQNWLSKIRKDNGGLAQYFNNSITEIVDAISGSTGYPKTLPLKDQGLFTIGYYHQKAYKNEDKNEE